MIIVDSHTHIRDIENNSASLYALAKRLNYSQLTVASLQCAGDLTQNLTCALCKLTHPGMTYAFGGLDYATGRDFASQAESLRAMGFDGVKMLEGKPTTRRMLGKALCDPQYDEYYSFLEATGFPVLLHVADPPEFWDKDKVPDWAVEHGWFYNENDVPYAQYYDEVEALLAKHPKLRATFAHFFFLSGEPEHAQRFLDAHPLVSIDITAGVEMYENFSLNPPLWREFFIKNSDRIIFGTDSSDAPDDGEAASDDVDISGYAAMEIAFLRDDREIEIYGKRLHGLGLPDEALRRIFSENFHRLVGQEPRPMDAHALTNEAKFIRAYIKNTEEAKKLDCLVARLARIK